MQFPASHQTQRTIVSYEARNSVFAVVSCAKWENSFPVSVLSRMFDRLVVEALTPEASVKRSGRVVAALIRRVTRNAPLGTLKMYHLGGRELVTIQPSVSAFNANRRKKQSSLKRGLARAIDDGAQLGEIATAWVERFGSARESCG